MSDNKAVEMVEDASKLLKELVDHVGRYPDDAFLFVREGLTHAAEQIHGPETEAHRRLYQYLSENRLDWDDLVARYHASELPGPVMQDIDAAGGCDRLNRHLSGRELCWGLRDYALQRWGMIARTVLESWNVKTTLDFGRIVFGFIDFSVMQKRPDDRIEDFEDVYRFTEAFDTAFRARLMDADGNSDAGDTSDT